MTYPTVIIKGNLSETLEADAKFIHESPKLMATAMRRNVSRLKSRMLKVRRAEPPPASAAYPLRYKSAKQRRKVHALRRERGGGSYVRTHELVNDWDMTVTIDGNGGSINIFNDNPVAHFVYDPFRQPMFDKIGWLDAVAQDDKDEIELQRVVDETWLTINDPKAGVK